MEIEYDNSPGCLIAAVIIVIAVLIAIVIGDKIYRDHEYRMEQLRYEKSDSLN